MKIIIDPLSAFYIAGSILMLFVAILVFPTLWDDAKKRVGRHK